MTYNEIAKMALTHLEYGTDDDSLAVFYERFCIYINDAVRLIARGLKLENVDTVTLQNGHFDVSALSKNSVTKIIEVFKDRRLYPVARGNYLGDFAVLGAEPSDTVSVRYRWIPEYSKGGDATPDIPELFHPIIYLYVVHCYHNTRSTSSDYDRTKWLQEFERERKQITREYGAMDAYIWKNKPWQTGEM